MNEAFVGEDNRVMNGLGGKLASYVTEAIGNKTELNFKKGDGKILEQNFIELDGVKEEISK